MVSYQEESQPLCRQGGGIGVAEDNYWTLPKINEISTNIIRENTYLADGEGETRPLSGNRNIINPTGLGT